MRICFLIRQLNEGGAQRQLLALVRGMDPARYDVTVLTFYPDGIFWSAFAELGNVRLECLHKRGRLETFFFLRRLAKRVRELRPDIMHGYLMGGNLFALLMRLFLPGLRIVWGIRTADAGLKAEAGFDKRLRGLERAVSHLPHHIVVNSEAGLDYYARNGFPRKKMSMIPNGVDLEKFKPDPEARALVRRDWRIENGELVIGMVGRLTPVKDHPTFLAAAAQFLARHGRIRFIVVGGGQDEYARRLASLAEPGLAGRMVWTGSRADVEKLYPAFDIFTSSSLVEGFPNAIAEAMACGVPVVATDAGDTRHIVGDTGIVVQPGQASALSDAWESMLPGLGSDLSARARARIAREFGVERLIERTQALFHSLEAAPI